MHSRHHACGLYSCEAAGVVLEYRRATSPVKVHVMPAVREELVLTSSWETVTSLALSSTGGIIEGCSRLVQVWRSVWISLTVRSPASKLKERVLRPRASIAPRAPLLEPECESLTAITRMPGPPRQFKFELQTQSSELSRVSFCKVCTALLGPLCTRPIKLFPGYKI